MGAAEMRTGHRKKKAPNVSRKKPREELRGKKIDDKKKGARE